MSWYDKIFGFKSRDRADRQDDLKLATQNNLITLKRIESFSEDRIFLCSQLLNHMVGLASKSIMTKDTFSLQKIFHRKYNKRDDCIKFAIQISRYHLSIINTCLLNYIQMYESNIISNFLMLMTLRNYVVVPWIYFT